MSPRNHRFPVSCVGQDMNMGRVSIILKNALNFDNWGCAAAILSIYLQLMCWKKDDITCCHQNREHSGQQAETWCKPHPEHFQLHHWKIKGKKPGFSCIQCEKQEQSAITGQHQQLRCAPVSLLPHFWIFGIVHGWPSSSPPLAPVQDVLHCWDLNCNHQLADNHHWWN